MKLTTGGTEIESLRAENKQLRRRLGMQASIGRTLIDIAKNVAGEAELVHELEGLFTSPLEDLVDVILAVVGQAADLVQCESRSNYVELGVVLEHYAGVLCDLGDCADFNALPKLKIAD